MSSVRARHHRSGRAPEKAGKGELVEPLRQREDGGKHEDGVAAQHYRGLQRPALPFRLEMVAATALHALPVHPGLAGSEDLQPVEPEVPPAGQGVFGQGGTERDERATIPGPAGDVGQPVDRRRLFYLLHRGPADLAQPHVPGPEEERPGPPDRLRVGGLSRSIASTSSAPILLGMAAECGLDPPHGAEQVHDQGHVGAARPLEQERRAVHAGRCAGGSPMPRAADPPPPSPGGAGRCARDRRRTRAGQRGVLEWGRQAPGHAVGWRGARRAYTSRSTRAKANTVTDMTAFMVKNAWSTREMSSARTNWCS